MHKIPLIKIWEELIKKLFLNKKLSRAEEGLSVFEQLRKEAEKQEIERQKAENQEAEKQEKTENVKEIKETDDLRKQQYDSEKAIFDIFHKNIDSDDQSENLNDVESSVEVTNNSVEKRKIIWKIYKQTQLKI